MIFSDSLCKQLNFKFDKIKQVKRKEREIVFVVLKWFHKLVLSISPPYHTRDLEVSLNTVKLKIGHHDQSHRILHSQFL